MTALDDDVAARAAAWIDDDPDPAAAAELTAVLAAARAGDPDAVVDLADRFSGPLEFGTAGLRGPLGAGEHRMNRAVVIRAAAGLSAFLAAELPGERPRVVIGFDARHGSAQFARDTAAVVTAAGGEAILLARAWPTPVLAFAVRQLDADAGVMVTASHNPPADNGYKVYLGGRVVTDAGQGAQIVPPYDAAIASRIAAVDAVASVPRATEGWTTLGEAVLEDYLVRAAGLAAPGSADLRIVLTPLHGVGGAAAAEALRRAGFDDVHVVAAQAAPDPDFPTVAFPNPEEPGALDLAFALARDVSADLVLAVDPDADRCGVAVPDAAAAERWRRLSGDDVGALLGAQAAALAVAGGAGAEPEPPVLASSIVSSRLLARIAAAHGLRHRSTLTGFKWISRVPGLAYGYEEALGYCVDPAAVRDKDGISAAVRVASLAAALRAENRSLDDALDDLAREHGLHVTAPLTVRVDDLALIPAAMRRLREHPPTSLAGSPVVRSVDLTLGLRVATPEGHYDVPPTEGLLYETQDGDRVIVRPSGTEPKLKAYLEVVQEVGPGDLAPARADAAARLADITADLRRAIGLDGTAAGTPTSR
ncbi:phosphoglucomutase/phosphomannomutase alpha/beta/alpha domain I [Beutenbergia cavernae DSM 12333]|uniref:Phosphoglucomutase/phosphomannomutase alpha/beta/alpha domain I n=1 Tax=Beutenbergia cavernae (strain ATCC BAA-8 / DSM 12333 / CCUG 43141 / JCM 11478 / NBRC 16432 / NCIMB 13614 / HKI 0122) TaxID=471853 RepID=C5BZ64_BEUC1|nr:phospho-sugar mutase [Beutenbergia cavernae]ACQ81179.1 phosphoglucomutase/phosphomannomutase alpha/beta/alpha domain I [Beutenbergia cavernae DSM 12333]